MRRLEPTPSFSWIHARWTPFQASFRKKTKEPNIEEIKGLVTLCEKGHKFSDYDAYHYLIVFSFVAYLPVMID